MKVVFDTGILVSACLYPDRLPATTYLEACLHFSIVSSSATIQELNHVLSRSKFDKWRDIADRKAWVEKYQVRTERYVTTTPIFDCSDPKDNIFLELAVDAKASVIVASDPHLLNLHPYQGIDILNIADFRAKYLREESL